MRAAVLHQFGPPERLVLGDWPEPVPGDGQVLIDVECAGIAFVETQVRGGRSPYPLIVPELPAVLGGWVGGTVLQAGPGADAALVGRRVVTTLNGRGGYAERAVAAAADVLEPPEGMALDQALGLLPDGRTALRAMRAAEPAAGEVVLVLAAAGGVGSLAVQLALARGAQVVAAVGSAPKLDAARATGAQQAVSYAEAGWAEGLGPVDVLFDGVGGEVGRQAFAALRDGGRVWQPGMASGTPAQVSDEEVAARHAVVTSESPPSPDERRALEREALRLGHDGVLRATIGQRFPLARAADAHAAIEARTTVGKTLLDVAMA